MPQSTSFRPLRGTRIVSLALNLPGPAALMRLHALGARCLKVEPPGPTPTVSGDPMGQYNPSAYGQMHAGIRALTIDLKSERGRARLARELAATDVLLTSFRPSALAKLGLSWTQLRRAHPQLSLVEIVGAPAERAEEPGHDLTYLAEAGLAAFALQIDGERADARVQFGVGAGVVLAHRVAAGAGRAGRLDLEAAGAECAQAHQCGRAGQVEREADGAHAAQRLEAGGGGHG